MSSFFNNLGRFVGQQARKANWVFRSLTGNEADAARAEHAVGRDLARAVLRQTEADPDPAVAGWLGEVGELLAQPLRKQGRAYTFRTLLLPEPNAFALPGGFVFVTRRLLKLCEGSHDDLAFVLAHEMAHIVRGHVMERLLARSLISATVGRYNPFGGLLRGPLAGLMSTLLQQGYSQDQEFEADAVAVGLLRRAGFDPEAGPRLLEKLRVLSADPDWLAGYFSSHPPLEQRITRLREGRPPSRSS